MTSENFAGHIMACMQLIMHTLCLYAVYYLEADQCAQTVHVCTCKK